MEREDLYRFDSNFPFIVADLNSTASEIIQKFFSGYLPLEDMRWEELSSGSSKCCEADACRSSASSPSSRLSSSAAVQRVISIQCSSPHHELRVWTYCERQNVVSYRDFMRFHLFNVLFSGPAVGAGGLHPMARNGE
jgi:hypothetical protein